MSQSLTCLRNFRGARDPAWAAVCGEWRARRKSMCGALSAAAALWCYRVARRRRRLRRTTDTTKTVWPTFPSIEALVVAVAAVYTESGLLEPHIRTGDKNLFKNRNFDVSMHIVLVNWRTTRIKLRHYQHVQNCKKFNMLLLFFENQLFEGPTFPCHSHSNIDNVYVLVLSKAIHSLCFS